jgi:hypothetical protein
MLRWITRTAVLCVAALVLARSCCAQISAPDDDKSTLHVYVNLVQIPVLVLNSSLHAIPRIPDSNFRVTIDGLGQIHPARIRMEGEDPINLALIVDRSVKDDTLWNDLPKSLEPLIQSLRSRDHISFLAMDGCAARRFGPEMAPFDAEWLKETAKVVTDMVPFKSRGKQGCPKPISYWELVMYAAGKLSQFPGRKILVTLGPGDKLNPQMAQQVHALLGGNSITLFPIIHGLSMSGIVPPRGFDSDGDALHAMSTQAELSGGMLLGTSYRGFGKTLAQPVELARGRYIIEFPRPDKLPAGTHYIQVADGHPRDFIRIAGISVPIAGPDEKRDSVVEHGAQTVTEAAASDDRTVSHESAQDHGDEKRPVVVAPLTSVPPAASSTVAASPTGAAPDATKGVAPKSPQPDPADITNDLRPQR